MRRYVENLRERSRELGPRYAVLAPLRRAAEVVQHRTERELLRIEGDRGVLGLAHRAWRDHAPEVNREHWGGWDWQHRGEEWTPSEAWKQGLVEEVLLPTVPPGGTVLEIGPGAGRWTTVLAPRADRLVVVDLDARILERCRETLGPLADRVELHLGDGSSLAMLGDAEVDAVWSFDVWVHIAPLGQQAYLAELARVLRPGGVAAIHHADGRDRGALPSQRGWRAPMTATLFGALAAEQGLEVERVVRSWGGGAHDLAAFRDAITVLRQPGTC